MRLAWRPTRRATVVLLAPLLLLAGCVADVGATATPSPTPSAEASAVPTSPPAAAECDATQSYEPGDVDTVVPGGAVERIRERGQLVVGVSSDTLLMGSRNPLSGKIEGFDIDVLHEIARALLGDPDKLQFRVITSAQRLDVLEQGEVDLVARTFTINCERWESIAFSAEYLHAGQKVLVTRDSTAKGIDDLAGRRVCAPAGTTTLERLAQYPDVEAVSADTHTACLVLFQQGRVDGITGDDTILAGFAAQDPYAKVVGDAISDEPYGIGAAAEDVDLVRFVNATLDTMKADGTWAKLYTRWLGALGKAPEPPESVYGRTPAP